MEMSYAQKRLIIDFMQYLVNSANESAANLDAAIMVAIGDLPTRDAAFLDWLTDTKAAEDAAHDANISAVSANHDARQDDLQTIIDFMTP